LANFKKKERSGNVVDGKGDVQKAGISQKMKRLTWNFVAFSRGGARQYTTPPPTMKRDLQFRLLPWRIGIFQALGLAEIGHRSAEFGQAKFIL
jgi:hypothetical protein